MRRLDELFLAWPFFGARRMTATLRAEGQRINRKRVRRLMRLMGLTALGPRPHLEAGAGAQDLPVPPARPRDRAREPGLGGRHH
jgi:putative transposase